MQLCTPGLGEDTRDPVHSLAASVNTWRWTGADVTQLSSAAKDTSERSPGARSLTIRLSLITATLELSLPRVRSVISEIVSQLI